MIRVIDSPSAEARLDAARSFIEACAPATEILIVGASRDAADDLARRVAHARGVAFGLHRASLTGLAVRFAASEMARLGLAPASSLGGEAIVARLAFEARAEAALPYLAPVARFPGFAPAVAATLGELRLAGIARPALARLGGSGRDVAELLDRLATHLARAKVADRATLLAMATRAATDDRLAIHGRMPVVLLDVPISDPSERAFVESVITLSPSALITVPAGDQRTLDALAEIGGERSVADETPVTASALDRARRYVFAAALPPLGSTDGEVVLFSAPGEGRECVEIARRVLEEARAGTAFDEIAVLLRAPDVYASLLEVAFRRAGIPTYVARGATRPDPAGRAFLALLDCAIERLSARRFAEYLSLGQVPPLDPAGAPPLDRAAWTIADDEMLAASMPDADERETREGVESSTADQDADERPVVDGTLRAPWKWEELLVESAVIGGRDRWRRRLAGLETEYRTRVDALRSEDPDSPRVAGIERDLANLEHLRRFALPLIDRLAALPTRGTWGEWLGALEALAPMVLRRPDRVLTVLAELRPLDVIGPVALAEVREVLADTLTTLAERPPAHRYGRVFVGTVEQARARTFEVVFVPGLAERMFPRKPREDPILLDALRRDLDAVLPTQTERGQRERLLLRMAVGAARRRLVLSYARLDLAEARPRVPSFYALEMARALTGRVPDPQAMERDAAASGAARLAWPAPDDARRAIDEVEHDLSTLGGLLATPDARGRARYLLEQSGCLARSLRTRWARWNMKAWTPYDGIVRVGDRTREAVAAARLDARAYSTSALQKFATCPYQFFLSAICRLEPREEVAPIVELDPMTRGAIFHRVQAELMRELQRERLLPLAPPARDAATAALDRVLARVAGEYHELLAPAIERVWQDELGSMRADLGMWLEHAIATGAEWEPLHFELAFGLPPSAEHDPRSVGAEVTVGPGFRLRGIIDLVERRRGTADLRVTDYKTGRPYWKARLVVGGGEVLQPVLYALALEQVLGGPVGESRLFYCTRVGNFDVRVVPMTDDARQRGVAVLSTVDRSIERGFLPPAPRRNACQWCDFRVVCGPREEQRLERKDRGPLEDLLTLRDWP